MNDSMIQNLLSDEQAKRIPNYPLLRLEIAKIFDPKPWEHRAAWDQLDCYCDKCHQRLFVPLSCDENGKDLNGDCPVPDLPTEPMGVLVEWLMEIVKTFERQDYKKASERFRQRAFRGHFIDFGEWHAFISTPAERAICALIAMEGRGQL